MPAAPPTLDEVVAALHLALPAWRHHRTRCPATTRCRREHAEWMDVLLDEYLAAERRAPHERR